jgi:hypothetical protein
MFARRMGYLEHDLPFRVEQWDAAGARLEQTLSASADLKLRRASFAEAIRQRPGQRIVLRHKTRVIDEYRPDAASCLHAQAPVDNHT